MKKATTGRRRSALTPEVREIDVSRAETMAAVEAAASDKRRQKSFYLTESCLARINAAVYWARSGFLAAQRQGEPIGVEELPDSASALIERAAMAEVIRLEKLFNKGRPFPSAPGRLSPGPGARGIERLRRPRSEADSDQATAQLLAGYPDT
jgi:hypothetical protein